MITSSTQAWAGVQQAANGDKMGIAPGGCWLPKEPTEEWCGTPAPGNDPVIPRPGPKKPPSYAAVVERTLDLVNNREVGAAAKRHGKDVVNVMWEDTHRFDNSSAGRNITDMTLAIQQEGSGRRGGPKVSLLPVIRNPNFADKTVDIPLDKFYVLVGNQKGGELERVTLREYLGDIRQYLHDPSSFAGDTKSLLKEGETHVLGTAQACFLPVPQGEGETVKFNPTVYNYQSYEGDPAVLTILCTPEGTSATIIDNKRDQFGGQGWGQPLFFNQDGKRASLVGGRISERPDELGGATGSAAEGVAAQGENMVMVIQVPLKQKNPQDFGFLGGLESASFSMAPKAMRSAAPSTEDAYITHGKVEGDFTEIDRQALVRDEELPIRVTVQFYKATDGNVTAEDVDKACAQIDKVYENGDYVGSLVVGRDQDRPTAPHGHNKEPKDFWKDWARKHERETGETPVDVAKRLKDLG
ncbi:MAG: hypothetical protein AB1758_23275, partial [Candidatus Eremiobacterota bacterium]